MGDAAEPGYNDVGDGAEAGARTMGDINGPEGAEGMVDITMPKKTNKIPILLSYLLNI